MESHSTLPITTPEGITFSLRLAGPVSRFLAWAIDLACIMGLTQALQLALAPLAFLSEDAAMGMGIVLYFVISTGYGIVLEWYNRGQTVGKRFMGLRVMDEQGLKLTFGQVVVRNLLRVVDMLPVCYLVGGAACFLSPRCKRLGDMAANTVVIRTPELKEPDLSGLGTDKYNSLLGYPHLAARLRRATSPAEAEIVLSALVRRPELEADCRVELFASLAAHFRAKVQFPQEATEGLSDEQYVRGVADILFRPAGTGAPA